MGQKYSDIDYWILGDLFMHDFYTIFDASDPAYPKIGLTLSTHAAGEAKVSSVEFDGTNKYAWAGLLVAFVLLVACCCCCLWRCKKRRQTRREERTRELAGEGNDINDSNVDIE